MSLNNARETSGMGYAKAMNLMNQSVGANVTKSNVPRVAQWRIGIGAQKRKNNAWIVSISWGTNEH